MKKLTYLLTALILTLFAQQAKASHAMGGELVYEALGNSQYRITLNFYRDCSGNAAPTDAQISITGPQINFTQRLPFVSSSQLSSSCQGTTSCIGGTMPGVEQYIYSGIVTLPTNENYEVSYSLCCRNMAITNLLNPDSEDLYLYTNIDNSLLPNNNSPYFTNLPTVVLFNGIPTTLLFSTIDVDGDSIAYEMTQPLGGSNMVINYNSGFSLSNPLTTTAPIIFDPLTGRMEFTPTGTQNAVLSVLIKEYRFGQQISTTVRDIQCMVVNTSNITPVLTINNVIPANNSLYVCVGDTLNFEVVGTDPNAGQTLDLTTSPATHSTTTNNNTTQVQVNYNWAPTVNDVSAQPYVFTVEAVDNGCPPASTVTSYNIYVTSCYSDVWPGDANSDFVANHYDILNIGRAWNYAGPARVGASTNWVAQSANNWPTSFISGLNHKYADCNGDGTIDSLDLDVITLNFGQTHLKDNERSMVGVPISVTSPTDTFTHGATVSFPISLGTSTEPANNVYGVAFTIDYDENLFDASSFNINFDNNWLANGNGEAITYYRHDDLNGSIDIAIARTDQTDLSGLGELCSISLNVKDDLTFAFVQSNVTVRGTVLEDFNENAVSVSEEDAEIVSTAPIDTSSNTGINELSAQLGIYPNPANSSITVNTNVQLNDLTIYNLAGQKLQSFQAPYIPQQIDIENLENGVYLISGQTTNGKRTYTRFVKMGSNK